MYRREKSTEWALLFPLKAGLFAVKSSISCTINRDKEKELNRQQRGSVYKKTGLRRGSSLSDLDKLQTKSVLPTSVRSAEKCYESLPQSRSNLIQLSSSQVRGSIGDLMNLKKYAGSTWSVRSETLITKFVPLSTVTPRQSPSKDSPDEPDRAVELANHPADDLLAGEPLTCAERTQRLGRLIKKHRQAVCSPFKKLPVSFHDFSN